MYKIGLGHDTHRLVEGSSILLGGVRIEHSRSLLGHSDADVLLHAITDALLGAAGLGDIGEFFPDTDSGNKNRDSAEMLRIVWNTVQSQGWRITNIDTIIFAEHPKIAPYKEAMKNKIAQILEIAPNQIGIKAKTGEKVGIIGREEAISAECVVLLETNLQADKT
ncbi:MAG: 2-C-methyl-D-erythritol 2,4-cyclodiphosphate synthase [Planctomycetaceae bacterium]|jgi:2-C-methyl-D-erythritol 2,4-cyclodiphosphate synthase|nr:2-C-methyl-D-erythritol 2,4-cyclodiphosphate synthase [Planctomycetaceae bacterium]